MLTAHQVQSDFIAMLKGSELASAVNGGIYRNGYRPRDSRNEDIIVTFVNGIPHQIEEGAVTVSIYVPDIVEDDSTYVEDGRRTAELEAVADAWVSSLNASHSRYKISLMRSISTVRDEAIHQHIVAVQMEYVYK